MKRIAIIKDNFVENVVIGELDFIQSVYPDYLCLDVNSTRCGPGMLYIEGSFLDNPSQGDSDE